MSLSKLLKAHGLSQTEAARRISLTPDKMSKIVNGKRNFTAKEIAALAEVLGIPTDAVISALKKEQVNLPERHGVGGSETAEPYFRKDHVIEYTWSDGHRVVIQSNRPYDGTTLSRIQRLLELGQSDSQ